MTSRRTILLGMIAAPIAPELAKTFPIAGPATAAEPMAIAAKFVTRGGGEASWPGRYSPPPTPHHPPTD